MKCVTSHNFYMPYPKAIPLNKKGSNKYVQDDAILQK